MGYAPVESHKRIINFQAGVQDLDQIVYRPSPGDTENIIVIYDTLQETGSFQRHGMANGRDWYFATIFWRVSLSQQLLTRSLPAMIPIYLIVLPENPIAKLRCRPAPTLQKSQSRDPGHRRGPYPTRALRRAVRRFRSLQPGPCVPFYQPRTRSSIPLMSSTPSANPLRTSSSGR